MARRPFLPADHDANRGSAAEWVAAETPKPSAAHKTAEILREVANLSTSLQKAQQVLAARSQLSTSTPPTSAAESPSLSLARFLDAGLEQDQALEQVVAKATELLASINPALRQLAIARIARRVIETANDAPPDAQPTKTAAMLDFYRTRRHDSLLDLAEAVYGSPTREHMNKANSLRAYLRGANKLIDYKDGSFQAADVAAGDTK